MSAALFEGFEPPVVVEPEPIKWTEAEFITRLRKRYSKKYANGPTETLRYVGASHVRYGPLWPSAIADFLVQDCWGNYGPERQRHPLIGFEIKVSRSDYLREIKDLSKSAPFREVCTEWIVGPREIVKNDLPDGWGHMVPAGDGLRIARPSAKNPDPLPIPRGLLAGFLRNVATQYEGGTDA